jgi:dTDP-4-amino-4,6-dideoxygalactose transaminase
MIVPMLDLKAQYASIKAEIDRAVAEVMEAQQFILGQWVDECERGIAEYCHCAHAVGVSSGTDALLVCLMAEGIGPGDEVVTSPYTFFATAGVIARVGARPVFVDIDPETFNLNPDQITAKITPRSRAIIPVHLFGQMAEMDAISAIAKERDLVIIEDAAQAIGAEFKGHRAGSIGHYGCLSFFPSKNLGAAGDGGMVVTGDNGRVEKLACLRAHGSKPKYHHKMIGGNFRLDTLQAAIVSAKLAYLDSWTAARQRNADRYNRLFRDAGMRLKGARRSPEEETTEDAGGWLVLPSRTTNRHIFNQYIVRVPQRDRLRAYLLARGISTEIYYPVPMHLQECFSYLGHSRGDFPESERAALQTLALPVYPELSEEQARYVVLCISDFFDGKA